MDDHGPAAPRPVLPATRLLLVAFSVLTLLGVNQLFILTELTDRYFAWTLDPPLSAAFLGAGYAAGCVLVVLILRTRFWANARIAVVTILVFTVLTLVATLLHVDRFHLTIASGGLPRFAAWFWLVVYLTVPPALLVLALVQERQPGGDPPVQRLLPGWLRRALALQGAIMLVVGTVLFAAPATSGPLWPWTLAPLSARAIAAWLIAFGFASAMALRERDLGRLAIPAVAYTVFGVLELVAVARYANTVEWSEMSAWVYVALLVSIVPIGAYGWWAARRTGTASAASAGDRPASQPLG